MNDFDLTVKLIKSYLPQLNLFIDKDKKTINFIHKKLDYSIKFVMDGIHPQYTFNKKRYTFSSDLISAMAVKLNISIKHQGF